MRLWQALRAFFGVLRDPRLANEFNRWSGGQEDKPPAIESTPTPTAASVGPASDRVPAPVRNDAVTMLAALQREARFVDIVKEPLGGYSDEQVGAAVRDVLRDCSKVLERLFNLQPVVDDEEGAAVEAPADFDPGRYHLTGNIAGDAPFRGKLVHHGWQITRCELPQWSGSDQSAMVVAPVELEVY